MRRQAIYRHYRGTSLTRNTPPLGPQKIPGHEATAGSHGGGAAHGRGTPVRSCPRSCDGPLTERLNANPDPKTCFTPPWRLIFHPIPRPSTLQILDPKPYTFEANTNFAPQGATPQVQHSTPHPAPRTLHPTLYTPHPTPCNLHPTPYTPHPTPEFRTSVEEGCTWVPRS